MPKLLGLAALSTMPRLLVSALFVWAAAAETAAARSSNEIVAVQTSAFAWTEREFKDVFGFTEVDDIVERYGLPEDAYANEDHRFLFWGAQSKIAVISPRDAPDDARYAALIEDAVETFNAALGPFGVKARQEDHVPDANIVFVVMPNIYAMARNEFSELYAVVFPDDGDRVHSIARAEGKGWKCFGAVRAFQLADGRVVSGQLVWFIDDEASTRKVTKCLHEGLMTAFGFRGFKTRNIGSIFGGPNAAVRIGATDLALIHAVYEHRMRKDITPWGLLRQIFKK